MRIDEGGRLIDPDITAVGPPIDLRVDGGAPLAVPKLGRAVRKAFGVGPPVEVALLLVLATELANIPDLRGL